MNIINHKTFPYLWLHVIAVEYRIENIGVGIITNVGLFSFKNCENWKAGAYVIKYFMCYAIICF